MKEEVRAILLVIGVLVAAIAAVTLPLAFFHHRTKRLFAVDPDDAARLHRLRLLNPDFSSVERHLGMPLPSCVRALYENQAELTREDFEIWPTDNTPEEDRLYVQRYCPADAQNFHEIFCGELEKHFAFAEDGFGNYYLIDPSTSDSPVTFFNHDGGDFHQVAESFSQVMSWRREPFQA